MAKKLVLASASVTRQKLLRNAGVDFDIQPARVDEDSLREAMTAEGAYPRDIADALAEMKARKTASRLQASLVLGCDQVLAFDGTIMAKPDNKDAAREQLTRLRGGTHQLLSAAVIYEDGAPVWRHVGVVRLTMRQFSDTFLEAYLKRNWPAISACVGGYKLEEEGVRLFSQVQGDYFCVLGLPLLELLGYLGLRGVIDT
ncbi:Maf family nucleotide pyrophosphatase [Roseovarius salis]|uniref:Maf family protein n=1 Tax=Roseovarius salis TaxID=3376063 RepID=UPI0037CB5D93